MGSNKTDNRSKNIKGIFTGKDNVINFDLLKILPDYK